MQIETLADAVRAWTGNRAAIAEPAEDEFEDLAERRPEIVADVREDGIDVAGDRRAADSLGHWCPWLSAWWRPAA